MEQTEEKEEEVKEEEEKREKNKCGYNLIYKILELLLVPDGRCRSQGQGWISTEICLLNGNSSRPKDDNVTTEFYSVVFW